MKSSYKVLVERFFRGVYGGDPAVVDELAAEDIVISYPVFSRLFDTPALRGRQAVKSFVLGFESRWAEPQITIHEMIAENDLVVLVWQFRARSMRPVSEGEQPSGEEHSWGGISYFRFNTAGEIVSEIGEESAPGPVQRLAAGEGG